MLLERFDPSDHNLLDNRLPPSVYWEVICMKSDDTPSVRVTCSLVDRNLLLRSTNEAAAGTGNWLFIANADSSKVKTGERLLKYAGGGMGGQH